MLRSPFLSELPPPSAPGLLLLLRQCFWWLDLAIAVGVTAFVVVGCRATAPGPWIRRLFWLGVAIGATWEVPLFVSNTWSDHPVLVMLSPPPVPPLVLIVFHSLWDGGLFLAGVALVWATCSRPILRRFRWPELAVLLLWGQLSALLVEVGGVTNDAWSYAPGVSWNPALFELAGHPITVLPQLIWLAAPVAFYLAALRVSEGRG